MTTRRDFLIGASTLVAGSLVLRPRFGLAADEAVFDVQSLGDGLWVLSGGGGNILLWNDGEARIMVDAGVPDVAAELLTTARRTAGDLAATLVNTHHHGDHVGANAALREAVDGLTIIGHARLVERLEPEQRPTVTMETDYSLDTGRSTARLHHFGAGHTDNDVVVHLPDRNLLHLGDLGFHGLHPYVLTPSGADIRGWRRSLVEARKLCDAETVVIPGHGAIGGREVIDDMENYFAQVEEVVSAALAEGRSREEVAELKPERFADRGFAQVSHLAMTRMYDELSGE